MWTERSAPGLGSANRHLDPAHRPLDVAPPPGPTILSPHHPPRDTHNRLPIQVPCLPACSRASHHARRPLEEKEAFAILLFALSGLEGHAPAAQALGFKQSVQDCRPRHIHRMLHVRCGREWPQVDYFFAHLVLAFVAFLHPNRSLSLPVGRCGSSGLADDQRPGPDSTAATTNKYPLPTTAFACMVLASCHSVAVPEYIRSGTYCVEPQSQG